MRRDGTMTVVNVKVERTSTDGQPQQPKESIESEPTRPVRIKKEKVDEPASSKATNKETNGATENASKKNDDSNDSLEIVPMETNPTIELSDDENGNDVDKMPPPAFVPPAKATKEKKAPAEKKVRSTRSKQVKRKVSLLQKNTILWKFHRSFICYHFTDQARAGIRKWGRSRFQRK